MRGLAKVARRGCVVPLFLVLFSVLAGGCGGAAADQEARGAPNEPAHAPNAKPTSQAESPYALPVVSRVQPPLLSAFALLREPADGLPFHAQRFFRKPPFGSNWDLARQIPVKAEGDYWLVPGDGHLCMIWRGAMGSIGVGATCAKTAEVMVHGIAAVSITPPEAPHRTRLIAGVAPDGTRQVLVNTDGVTTAVPVRAGAFALRDSTLAPPEFISLR
jgi:hypothetical protein